MSINLMPVVYLAGGMRTRWQDIVMAEVPEAVFIDPRQHAKNLSEKEYTAWDLTGVERADFVFGYLEKDNPSGAGLALEMGYGAAKGKKLIFVEEPGFPHTRYFGMVRAVSDFSCDTLEEGIQRLKQAIFTFRMGQ